MSHHTRTAALIQSCISYRQYLLLGSIMLSLLILSGCGAITESQCRFADFSEIGYADASKGRVRSYFNKYQEKCLSYDINLAEEIVMYDYGRERALINYCDRVKYSSQCDRGGGDAKVKSYLHINAEMLRLRSGLPQVTTGISR